MALGQRHGPGAFQDLRNVCRSAREAIRGSRNAMTAVAASSKARESIQEAEVILLFVTVSGSKVIRNTKRR